MGSTRLWEALDTRERGWLAWVMGWKLLGKPSPTKMGILGWQQGPPEWEGG